jgi:hypothetical protein
MSGIASLLLITLGFVIICAPRRWAVLAMVTGALFLGQGAAMQLAGFNFFPTRILGVICFARVLVRKEVAFHNLSTIDRRVLYLYAFVAVVNIISPHRELDTFAKCLDALFYYFSFRGLIDGMSDLRWFLRTFVWLLVPYVVLVVIERVTHQNLFVVVGGEQHMWTRSGRMRCFGSFRHPDLLGALGATFFPLYIALCWERFERHRALLGAALCTAIVVCTNSGGPLSAFAAGLIGLLFWKMRTRMQLVRRWALGTIVALSLIMKAPFFYLIARLSSVTGGGGWHRAYLIDQALDDLPQWWAWGMPLIETRHWFPYFLKATGGADLTNQFVVFGVASGLGSVLLACYLFTGVFGALGTSMAESRRRGDENHLKERLLWAFGVAVWVHMVTWLGIAYFDQFLLFWCLQLAAIAAVVEARSRKPVNSSEEDAPAAREPAFAAWANVRSSIQFV